MIRSFLAFVATALLIPPADGAPKVKDPPKPVPSIVGEWIDEASGRQYVLQEDGLHLQVGEKAGPDSCRFVANFKTEPAEFDLIHPAAKATFHGICKLEGDTLTVCLSGVGNVERPARFGRSSDPYVVMVQYKRKKTKD